MGRPLRAAQKGYVYHVLNRAVARLQIFDKPADYDAFDRVLEQAVARTRTRLLAYCTMPNHWHLVVWPREDGELSAFVGWLSLAHTQRWHAHRGSAGSGHLYQGRFKSFPVESDQHFLVVCRYVERNPLRAGLVERADEWRWSSLYRRQFGDQAAQALCSDWPVPRPRPWLRWVIEPQTEAELHAIRRSVLRGQPFGGQSWVQRTTRRLGLESTFRPRGRPKTLPVSPKNGS